MKIRKQIGSYAFNPKEGFRKLLESDARDGNVDERYRDTSLMKNTPLLGPYRRTIPRVLWWSLGGAAVSYERSTSVGAAERQPEAIELISQKVFTELFYTSPFPHKFVNLFFILVLMTRAPRRSTGTAWCVYRQVF